MKLDIDEREHLNQMMLSEAWPALVKQIQLIIKANQDQLMNMDAASPQLAFKKAELDGMFKIFRALLQDRDKLTK